MSVKINSYVSRYVVPFYYDYENDGYRKVCQAFSDNHINNSDESLPKDGKWIEVGFLENYKSDKKVQSETELYSYLTDMFLDTDKEKDASDNNLGKSFFYRTNGKLFDLEYNCGEKSISFDCKDLGVILFRNGIGFIWYEIRFKNEISSEEYIKFQHDFKELARTHDNKFVKKIGFDKDKKENIYESFVLGTWLSNVIVKDMGIKFWAEKSTKQAGEIVNIPDKALLCQYVFIDDTTNQESNNLLFQITNGYDQKYNFPSDMDECIFRPFGNTVFYITKAGMACVVINKDSNESFFKGQFRDKYKRDYFFIYQLLLYQSYACANYSRLLTKLPADEKTYNKNTKYITVLESLNSQINLFLVKSVFESVSNVHHQNGLYRYGKKELHIEEDIQSLTIGLDALKDIEKDKRDSKVDKALVVFGFIVVTSAWIDGLNLVDWFMNNRENINLWHIGVSAFIGVFSIYLIIILLWNKKNK